MAFTKSFMETTFEDICKWCAANGEGAWLKLMITEEIDKPVYPTVKKLDKNGKEIEVIDKKAKAAGNAIGTEKSTRSYIEIKRAFFEKFFPSDIPVAKEKATTMSALYAKYFK